MFNRLTVFYSGVSETTDRWKVMLALHHRLLNDVENNGIGGNVLKGAALV